MCAECGSMTPQSEYRTYRCGACGHIADRDANAAVNVRNRAFGSGPFQSQVVIEKRVIGRAASRWARPMRGSFSDQRSQAPRSRVTGTLWSRLMTVPR
ncbi:MAG: transposase [Chloroflexi bacterium]|nr:transposase [Chloroflexota bacterium]MYE41622.1 transposase [Chloroflexota bacterium]